MRPEEITRIDQVRGDLRQLLGTIRSFPDGEYKSRAIKQLGELIEPCLIAAMKPDPEDPVLDRVKLRIVDLVRASPDQVISRSDLTRAIGGSKAQAMSFIQHAIASGEIRLTDRHPATGARLRPPKITAAPAREQNDG